MAKTRGRRGGMGRVEGRLREDREMTSECEPMTHRI